MVNGWTSQHDQPPLSSGAEEEAQTRAGMAENDKLPQLPSTSNELVFLQSQSQIQQPEFSLAAPTKFSLSTAAPVFLFPSMSVASQTVTAPPGYRNFSTSPSAHLRKSKVHPFPQVSHS